MIDMLGCLMEQIEPLQIVRYKPGQFFDMHHDMADINANGDVVLPPKRYEAKRRLVTLFVYLNTLSDEQGGCTYFPNCNNLRIRPQRGRLVIWSNVTANGQPDARTIHAGEPVIQSPTGFAKYGLNIWICEE